MNCHMCGVKAHPHFESVVLQKHAATYYYCSGCDHVFAGEPNWLAEAYSEATGAQDTDTATRNVLTALRLASFNFLVLGERGKGQYIDVAGGYGLLTRLMRDLGFNYFWSDRYAKNLFARCFEYTEPVGSCTAASAIEVLEHTVAPLDFLRDTLQRFQTDTLLFTTETFPDGRPPKPDEWSYYSFQAGQHISFFSRRGLSLLADRLDMRYMPFGRIHVFTKRPLSALKVRLAGNKFLVVPLALLAAFRLGSRRASDQAIVKQALQISRS